LAHLEPFEHAATNRLIPAKYSGGSVLETLSLPQQVLSDLSELDAATNERKLAENGQNVSIGPGELLYGVPNAKIINAAFCHPGPHGSRFNNSQRGAWYAAVELETSMSEVVFHKRLFLQEGRITGQHVFEYVNFLADFSGQFHALEPDERTNCLEPAPVPQCYGASQALAIALLYSGSNGIVYPSVRRESGTCVACFRPALVFHARPGSKYRVTVEAGTEEFSFASIE
jgi:hypothetical protein